MEYLGFWVTQDSVKPTNRKIEAINNMAPNTSQKEVRKFIGLISYDHNMCPRRPHTLGSLTKLTYIKRNLKWTRAEQDS